MGFVSIMWPMHQYKLTLDTQRCDTLVDRI
jgi:hypothetical protein